ncbi:MAG: GNAT family N-acetyltransferase [Bacteroidia bacterium]|nr:GNAT family N-acetyltransferase [Bacteroidia bacterium]
MKIIVSPHLFLYPFEATHAELLADWVPDKRTLLAFGGEGLTLPLTAEQLVASSDPDDPKSDRRLYSVSSRDVGMLAGHGEILDIDHTARSGRLARVLLAPMFRGAGFGHELVALLCTAAFDIVELREVTLRVFEDNAAAIACYDRAGFVRTDAAPLERRIGRKTMKALEMRLTAAQWKSVRPDWARAMRQGEDCCDH